MGELDRRRFMKSAAASAALVAPAVAIAQAPEATPRRSPRGDDSAQREHVMSAGGFSKARISRLHDVMAGYVERGEVPGVVTLASRGAEVYVDAIGAKSVGGDPIGRDTIFRIASLSKPVMAAATMVLVEECKLRLDEPVDRLLPELANRKVLKRLDGPVDDTVPAKRPITLRDLLTFRLGFGLVLAPPGVYPIADAANQLQIGMGPPAPADKPAPDEWIRRLGTLPVMFQPGERWMYNTGSDVLSVLLARASGQPLETFLRERIFEPLGMKDTGFSVPAEKIGRLATSYWTNYNTGAREVYDKAAGGAMEPAACVPVRRRRPGFDYRRLLCLRPDDVEPGQARQEADSLDAVGRNHDHRPVDARAESRFWSGRGFL